MPIRRRGSQARRHPGRRASGPGFERATSGDLDPFELLVERAIDGLPAAVQRLLEEVAVVISDEPSPIQRRENRLAPEETLYGLYEGTPRVEWGADHVAFPNKITLFRVPLEADFDEPAELAQEVQRTLRHELAHHVGFDEARMEALGLG